MRKEAKMAFEALLVSGILAAGVYLYFWFRLQSLLNKTELPDEMTRETAARIIGTYFIKPFGVWDYAVLISAGFIIYYVLRWSVWRLAYKKKDR